MEDIIKEYEKSTQGHKISIKQKDYINILIKEIIDPKEKERYSLINVELLNKLEIFNLIGELKKIIPANMHYLTSLYHRFTNYHIKKLLKKSHDQFIITQYDAELILKTPDKFSNWMKEHPIRSEEYWEYGWQENAIFPDGKMEYLKFYDMMMLDYDGFTYEELCNHLKLFDKYRFRIYKSYEGFHVFIISDPIHYNSERCMVLSKAILSDIHYNIFCSKTGFKVRLTAKPGRKEDKLYEYISDVGNGETNELCEYLIKIHDKFINLK